MGKNPLLRSPQERAEDDEDQLVERVNVLEASLAAAQAKLCWRDVNDELPDIEAQYLVQIVEKWGGDAVSQPWVGLSWYDKESCEWDEDVICPSPIDALPGTISGGQWVTHWLPIPEFGLQNESI